MSGRVASNGRHLLAPRARETTIERNERSDPAGHVNAGNRRRDAARGSNPRAPAGRCV